MNQATLTECEALASHRAKALHSALAILPLLLFFLAKFISSFCRYPYFSVLILMKRKTLPRRCNQFCSRITRISKSSSSMIVRRIAAAKFWIVSRRPFSSAPPPRDGVAHRLARQESCAVSRRAGKRRRAAALYRRRRGHASGDAAPNRAASSGATTRSSHRRPGDKNARSLAQLVCRFFYDGVFHVIAREPLFNWLSA